MISLKKIPSLIYNIGVYILLFLAIFGTPSETEEITKMLEYQFSQRLEKIQLENKELQDKIASLEKARADDQTACNARIAKVEEEKAVQIAKIAGEINVVEQDERDYYKALKFVQAEDWDQGLVRLENFIQKYPTSELADNAIYWMAQIYLQRNETELARSELVRLLGLYPRSERAMRAQAHLESLPDSKTLNYSSGDENVSD